jgi:hypothetical protein
MKRNNKSLPSGVTQTKSNLSFVNLSTYTSPEIVEVSQKEWVGYGADNNYFQFLIDRYNGSPTNNAAINGISQQIYGKGLSATDANRRPDQYAQMITMFSKDCVRKLCYDLKLMGQCSAQVIYSKDRSKIVSVEHIPVETLRAEKCNEEGDIPAYYYFKDWTKIKPSDKPLRIPAFGMSKEAIEIFYIKPYRSGFYYYSPVDYQGGIQYAEIEEEVSNYHLNNIINSFAPTTLINMNNGVPNQEERELIESRIASKFTGSSNAGRFILSFNDNKESSSDIISIPITDAHNQYQFLSTEATQKILVAHRIVSPMLMGIRDGGGFSSNADEIKNASILMDNTVIRPFQELLIESFDQILAYNGISLNLFFITLQPLEFTEIDTDLQDEETVVEETGIEMSSDTHLDDFISLGESEEELLSNYELIDVSEVDYDKDDGFDLKVQELNEPSLLSKIVNLVSIGTARPKAKSAQDGGTKQDPNLKFLVRYQYAPLKTQGDSRLFCNKMVSAAKIYRKEDIIQLTDKPVNAGFGVGGSATYSIWLYKGGARCNHKWFRKTYMIKDGDQTETTTTAARSKGFVAPVNEQLVPVAPKDMQYKGYTAAYWNKMGFKN